MSSPPTPTYGVHQLLGISQYNGYSRPFAGWLSCLHPFRRHRCPASVLPLCSLHGTDTGITITINLTHYHPFSAYDIFKTKQVLTLNLSTPLRSRFITYGARATPSTAPGAKDSSSSSNANLSPITRALDFLASLQVPHSYFTQFYVVSVLSSLFWVTQLLLRGSVFQAVSARISPEHLQNSMSVNQVLLCWALMTVHSSRRLAESFVFSKPSTSRMWFVHWLLGIAFYLAATVAIWIEGAGRKKLVPVRSC